VVIYGVEEDTAAKTFTATPFSLVGFKERISQVVDTRIREHIDFAVYELQLDTDPTQGFAVVVVPPSLRAPHQEEATGRYYGRQPGGNRVLGEAEIARLYERRQRAEESAQRALDEAIAHRPIEAAANRGDLYLVAMPLVSDTGLRERALAGESFPQLVQDVLRAERAVRFSAPAGPNFGDMINGGHPLDTIEGVAFLNPPVEREGEATNNNWVSRLEFTDNGTLRYYHAALAGRSWSPDQTIINDAAVAQITAHFCVMAGELLERGGYFGAVEVLIALIGAAGAVSWQWTSGTVFPRRRGTHELPTNDFRDHVRVQAARLKDQPVDVAGTLVSRLLRPIRPQGWPNPLA